jgi:hypothetical protein
MSDTILGGDFTVYYEAENRQKRLEWTGSATGTRTVNELYSALQDLFDELNQMDDGTPMSAQTPTEYTIGIIDAGDDDPWFIDRETVEHLTGGAIQTASWLRVEDSNTGIVRMEYTAGTALDPSDIGLDILMTGDGDRGTLLDYNIGDLVLFIRPDDDTIGNSFNDAPTTDGPWTIVGGTGTGNQANGAALSGEALWANIFSIGTIESNTHLHVYQNSALLTGYISTTDWWDDGQIDILVNVKEVGTEIDEAVVTVFARQYSKSYDNFGVDLSAGGRNPIPLSTGGDLDNTTGYREMVLTDVTVTDFVVGEVITDSDDETIQGIVTFVTGTIPTQTIQYYLMGDPLNDFTGATGTFTGEGGASATAVGPTDVGPAALAGTSIVHANTDVDVDDDSVTEPYSITIDCNTTPLDEVYEWTKYITRRGGQSTGDTDGVEGEQYIGNALQVEYVSQLGNFSEGQILTGATSGAVGTIVADHDDGTDGDLILRNTRDTFVALEPITDPVTGDARIPISSGTRSITPVKAAPFGTFAGGVWFCAPGVVLTNVPTADENNYQVIDDDGNVNLRPVSVTVTLGNTRRLDRLAMFRLTGVGGQINKSEYSLTSQSIKEKTLVTDEGGGITADTVGKTTGGVVRVVDVSAEQEYRLRFSSWVSSTWTLAATVDRTAGTDTDTTTLRSDGVFVDSKVGDLILNTDRGNAVSYVVSESPTGNTVDIFPAIAGQVSGDTFSVNVTPVALISADTAYVPFIDAFEITGDDGTPGSEVVSVVYSGDIPVRIRARQAGDILPYEADAAIESTGLSNNVIRTSDSIFT